MIKIIPKIITGKIITALFCLLICFPQSAFNQDIAGLNQASQERIERLEELVSMYTSQEDHRLAANYLNQISIIYWENKRLEKAAESFYRAAESLKAINDQETLYKVYSNIGLIYLDLENLAEADRAFTKNLEIRRESRNKQGISTALVDLAYVKNLRLDFREAIKLLEESLQLALEINYETILPTIYRQLANGYTSIGNNRKGDELMKKYTDVRDHISRQTIKGEFQEREEQNQIEILRQQAEAQVKEWEMEKRKFQFQLEQDSITAIVKEKEDSLIQARRIERIQKQDIEILEIKTQLDEELIERQQAVQNFQQLVIYSILVGLGLLLILALLMFRSNRAKRRANKELATKNKQIEQAKEKLQHAFGKIEDQNYRITQSISYAREIQRALFPPIETLSQFLPESFIFFQPVDIVSGDFYWFREASMQLQHKKELVSSLGVGDELTSAIDLLPQTNGSWLPFHNDKFIIAAVDCTGHGVPGAFMSMIGYNLLDSITGSGITHPERILGKLHNGVRNALKQEETTNRDGMDISMCVINKQNHTVEFAGANNPVIYISDGQLSIIKGDMMAIGGNQKKTERKFHSHIIKVDKPTSFYIFTDGFTDQFGGKENKKLSMKNFKELLLDIHTRPMQEQKMLLENYFNEWKKQEEQVDDVLVIGFKLK